VPLYYITALVFLYEKTIVGKIYFCQQLPCINFRTMSSRRNFFRISSSYPLQIFFDLRIFHFYSVIVPILKFIIKNLHLLYNSIIIVLHELLKSATFINFSNTVRIILILGSNNTIICILRKNLGHNLLT
jgi:hypothetical protein